MLCFVEEKGSQVIAELFRAELDLGDEGQDNLQNKIYMAFFIIEQNS